jgi:hypothetical protein
VELGDACVHSELQRMKGCRARPARSGSLQGGTMLELSVGTREWTRLRTLSAQSGLVSSERASRRSCTLVRLAAAPLGPAATANAAPCCRIGPAGVPHSCGPAVALALPIGLPLISSYARLPPR